MAEEDLLSPQVLDQLDPDLRATLNDLEVENFERFKQTDDLSALTGLQTLGVTPEGVKVLISLGKQLVKQNLHDKAERFFTGLLQLEPLNWRVWQMLGIVQHKQRRHKAAAMLYTMADLYALGKDAVTKLYLGECLVSLDKQDEGLDTLKAGLDLARGQPSLETFITRAEGVIAAQEARRAQEIT